jgi:hypothetical protein
MRCRHDLATENLALRQQFAVMKYHRPRPRLTDSDRSFWVVLSRIWSGWQDSLHVVQPETVLRWHRQGFRYYWRWRPGRPTRIGRGKIEPESRELIRRMPRETPLWGQGGPRQNWNGRLGNTDAVFAP